MDNQNDSNNSMQNPLNCNTEHNVNEQNLYVPINQQHNQNNNMEFSNGQNNFNTNGAQNFFALNSMIDSLSGWMKFIGIYTIVIGVISCLGIISAAIGVPLIFAGIALTKGSNSIKSYKQYQNQYMLNEVLTSLNKYFKITGIITIVTVIISIVCFIFFIFAIIFAANGSYRYY